MSDQEQPQILQGEILIGDQRVDLSNVMTVEEYNARPLPPSNAGPFPISEGSKEWVDARERASERRIAAMNQQTENFIKRHS